MKNSADRERHRHAHMSGREKGEKKVFHWFSCLSLGNIYLQEAFMVTKNVEHIWMAYRNVFLCNMGSDWISNDPMGGYIASSLGRSEEWYVR